MSEKRFSLELQNNDIFDKKTNTFYCDNESVCDLLNEQQSVIDEQNRRIRKLEGILKKFQFPVERVGE